MPKTMVEEAEMAALDKLEVRVFSIFIIVYFTGVILGEFYFKSRGYTFSFDTLRSVFLEWGTFYARGILFL